MNSRLATLAQQRQAHPTQITKGSETVRDELVRLMKEANLNPNQTRLLLGVSSSCIGAWLNRDRKCPRLLIPAINFVRLQCGLSVELEPKK